LADNKESDALLDVLHIYSEELLESEDSNQNIGTKLQTIDDIECQQISLHDQTSHLGSIKDLITLSDHLYLKTTELTTDSIIFDNNNDDFNINNYIKNNCPLSPVSCNSDSGYESVASPSLSLSDQIIDTSDVCLESFTELFPDLV
jgi:hypothetical protein